MHEHVTWKIQKSESTCNLNWRFNWDQINLILLKLKLQSILNMNASNGFFVCLCVCVPGVGGGGVGRGAKNRGLCIESSDRHCIHVKVINFTNYHRMYRWHRFREILWPLLGNIFTPQPSKAAWSVADSLMVVRCHRPSRLMMKTNLRDMEIVPLRPLASWRWCTGYPHIPPRLPVGV